MSDWDKILSGLVRRTNDGKLGWSRSITDNEFVTSIETISVVVRDTSKGAIFGSGRYQLAILDDEDEAVAVLEVNDTLRLVPDDRDATPEQASQLAHLFELARRSALNTQATLEKLAKALEAD